MSQLPTSSAEHPPPYDNAAPKSTYSQLVDKLMDTATSKLGYSTRRSVDRKSLSQGVKLVEIAVEEFETGNEAIGLDVYLAGLDKIIMALPSKTHYSWRVSTFCNLQVARPQRNQDKTSAQREIDKVG